MKRRKLLNFLISVGLGAFFLWIAARGVHVDQLVDQLRAIEPIWLLPYPLIIVAIQVLRVWRWQILLEPIGHVPFWRVFAICSVGFAAIILLPLRMGEFVRPYLIADEGIRPSAALGTVAVERVVDGVSVALILVVVTLLTFPDGAPPIINTVTWAMSAIFGGGLLFILAAFAKRDWVLKLIDVSLRIIRASIQATLGRVSEKLGTRIAEVFAKVAEKALGIADGFIDGLNLLHSWRSIAIIIFTTLGYWVANAVSQYLVFMAFGFHEPPYALGMGAAFVSMAVLVGFITVPTGPGFAGNFEAAYVISLGDYGVPKDAALPYALVLHAVQTLGMVAFALYFLLRGKVSFARAMAATEVSDEPKLEGDPAT